MASIKIQSTISFQDLLKGVEQLEINDLERFLEKVLKLRAKKITPSLSKKESSLLKKINKPIPKKLQERFQVLNKKRKAETLNAIEHQELIDITLQFEKLNVSRLKALADLSKIKQVPVRELMTQLDISLKAA